MTPTYFVRVKLVLRVFPFGISKEFSTLQRLRDRDLHPVPLLFFAGSADAVAGWLLCRPPQAGQPGQEGLWTLVGSIPLVKHGPSPKVRHLRKLLSRGGGGDGAGEGHDGGGSADVAGKGTSSAATSRKRDGFISFWKPEVRGVMAGLCCCCCCYIL